MSSSTHKTRTLTQLQSTYIGRFPYKKKHKSNIHKQDLTLHDSNIVSVPRSVIHIQNVQGNIQETTCYDDIQTNQSLDLEPATETQVSTTDYVNKHKLLAQLLSRPDNAINTKLNKMILDPSNTNISTADTNTKVSSSHSVQHTAKDISSSKSVQYSAIQQISHLLNNDLPATHGFSGLQIITGFLENVVQQEITAQHIQQLSLFFNDEALDSCIIAALAQIQILRSIKLLRQPVVL